LLREAVIARAALLVGVRGHFTRDPELERRPFSPFDVFGYAFIARKP
jgi:hypothetical protein